jgi:hypothetical protein
MSRKKTPPLPHTVTATTYNTASWEAHDQEEGECAGATKPLPLPFFADEDARHKRESFV